MTVADEAFEIPVRCRRPTRCPIPARANSWALYSVVCQPPRLENVTVMVEDPVVRDGAVPDLEVMAGVAGVGPLGPVQVPTPPPETDDAEMASRRLVPPAQVTDVLWGHGQGGHRRAVVAGQGADGGDGAGEASR